MKSSCSTVTLILLAAAPQNWSDTSRVGPRLVIQSKMKIFCSLKLEEHQSAGQWLVPSVKLEHFFITNIPAFLTSTIWNMKKNKQWQYVYFKRQAVTSTIRNPTRLLKNYSSSCKKKKKKGQRLIGVSRRITPYSREGARPVEYSLNSA